MSRTRAVIEFSNVSKQFGKFAAVAGLTATVRPGQIVGFVGANGAGKTTTISMMLGFLNASTGSVKLFDQHISPSNAHTSHHRIGYAAGDLELPAELTGRQYLTFLQSQRTDGIDNHKALLRRFSPQLDKKIRTLSRGNKQKIALVAAFLGEPELVILDEPTSGLDPVMQEAFLDTVREYKKEGKTVFMSSHYLQEVMDVCDRVLLMSKGKLVEDVTTADLQLMGGKQVRIQSTYKSTKPPKQAESVATDVSGDILTLSFVFKGTMDELQRWLTAVKQLKDVEISEYNLEESFKALYEVDGSET